MSMLDYRLDQTPRTAVRRVVHLLAVLLPVAPILVLYTFVITARVECGHWPKPFQPKPSTLHSYAFYRHAIGLAFTAGVASPIVILIPNVLWGGQYWRRSGASLNALFALTFVTALTLILCDFGNFCRWAFE